MSEKTTTEKVSKNKGSNKTPKQRQYIAYDTRAMKKSVELFKEIYKVNRLTASQRSALAYFLIPITSGNSEG
jgi:hypothetical protein